MMACSTFARFLRLFPSTPSFAFAYGSKVKIQANEASAGDMIDLIIAVDDPLDFHRKNLEINGKHYSFLRMLGPRGVCRIQERMGAKIYYNTLVPVDDGKNLIKYGVIKTQDLINDLLDWETLYVSGRLHKPVNIIRGPIDSSEPLFKALQINHQSAIRASLLLLDERFTEESLYWTIASLSYSGDFRMIFGENKNKVSNIVKPQIESFRKLYRPYLTSPSFERFIQWNSSSKTFVQDLNPQVILHHLNLLPKNVQTNLYFMWSKSRPGSSDDLEDVLQNLSERGYGLSEKVSQAVSSIVRRSSWSQSLKGLLTAGLMKSLSYARRKIHKMYEGNRITTTTQVSMMIEQKDNKEDETKQNK